MKFKKTQVLIAAFLIFWIVFIGWGMLKTGLKLFQEKPTASAVSKAEKPQIVWIFKLILAALIDMIEVPVKSHKNPVRNTTTIHSLSFFTNLSDQMAEL